MLFLDEIRKMKDKFNNKKEDSNSVIIPESNMPDEPVPFGYGSMWLAIKGYTPQQVIQILGIKNAVPSKWAEGINAQTYESKTFISPVIDDYVLVIGIDKYIEDRVFIANLAKNFSNMCVFGAQKNVEYCLWEKYVNGDLIRGYCYIGGAGGLEWSEGEFTPEEVELGFDKYIQSEDEWDNDDCDDIELPSSCDVSDIAAAWTIDPNFYDFTGKVTSGYLGDF